MKEYFTMVWWMFSFKRNVLINRPLAIALGLIAWLSVFVIVTSMYNIITTI